MGRLNATSWLAALLVLVIGGMGSLRDVHAASHTAHAAEIACESADSGDSTHHPATLPAPDDDKDCPTCDLLAVLSKSIDAPVMPAPVIAHEFLSRLRLPTPETPVVVERPRQNRTRGPPSALSCAA